MLNRWLVAAAVAFSLLPNFIVLLASFTAGNSLSFPPTGLSFRWYQALLDSPQFVDAFATSLMLAITTTVIAVALSVLAAFAIVRHRFTGAGALEAFFLSPLALPHVVIGIGILQIYSELGLRASMLTLLLGHLIVTVPFTLRLTISSLTGIDARLEQAAASLGARPRAVLARIVLPQMWVGVAGALVAGFILSFDDVALTVFLVQPGYTTLPVLLFTYAENNPTPLIHVASVLLLIVSWAAVLVIDRIVGIERLLHAGRDVA